MDDQQMPWWGELVVAVLDSRYGIAPFLADVASEPNLVTIARLRSNRVLYYPPRPEPRRRGRRPWYGDRFALGDEPTWTEPHEACTFQRCTSRGRWYDVELRAWRQMRMKGKRGFPMHEHPFTLLSIECRDATTRRRMFRRPMWLAVVGARREELTPQQVHDAFRQRFDEEHCHRFLRQRLLLDACQTPVTGHEENWVQLVRPAYWQLFAARDVAQYLPRPWERARKSGGPLSPTMVQRDLARILGETGTPALPPNREGKSPGRRQGESPGRRRAQKVVYKARASPYWARAPAP